LRGVAEETKTIMGTTWKSSLPGRSGVKVARRGRRDEGNNGDDVEVVLTAAIHLRNLR
jgi:hypothetical protein